jgi:hypothetical protein
MSFLTWNLFYWCYAIFVEYIVLMNPSLWHFWYWISLSNSIVIMDYGQEDEKKSSNQWIDVFVSVYIFTPAFRERRFSTPLNSTGYQGPRFVPPDHLLLDSAPNLRPLISRWEINKFKHFWYKSVRILEALKLLFQQFLNLSSSQRDMSGPRLGALSNNKWSGGSYGPIACLNFNL